MSAVDKADIKRKLEDRLFDGSGAFVYAVLDGARNLETLAMLEESDSPFLCVYTGRLDPEVAVVAPYLVELREDDEMFDLLFDDGWGESRGIFLTSDQRLRSVRRHLKSLTYAEMPDGEMVLFRFYDPRALRTFMPVANDEQREGMFGGVIDTFVLENEPADGLIVYEKQTESKTKLVESNV